MKERMGDKRYFYITPEDYKIAEENGISKDTLLSRVRKLGWDVDKAITKPVRVKRKFTEEEIKTMEENGVNQNIAANRMYWGWNLEEAITKPKKRGRQYVYPEWVYKEADKNGISYSALGNRIRRGMSLEEACTKKMITRLEALEIARKKLKESKKTNNNQ